MPKRIFGRKRQSAENDTENEGSESNVSAEAENGAENSANEEQNGSLASALAEKAHRAFKLGSDLKESDEATIESSGGDEQSPGTEEGSGEDEESLEGSLSEGMEAEQQSEDMNQEAESRTEGKNTESEEIPATENVDRDSVESEPEPKPENQTVDSKQTTSSAESDSVDENYDRYLRAVAELENVKKRNARERSELIRYAGEHLAVDLLDVLDDFERALGQETAGGEELLEGVRMIHNRFITALERHGIKGEDGIGSPFDPAKQEALASVPTEGKEPGTVIEQFKKAYFFKDKLIRPAQVVVSAAMAKPEEDADEAKSDEIAADESIGDSSEKGAEVGVGESGNDGESESKKD